jgi:hypothetical protein
MEIIAGCAFRPAGFPVPTTHVVRSGLTFDKSGPWMQQGGGSPDGRVRHLFQYSSHSLGNREITVEFDYLAASCSEP